VIPTVEWHGQHVRMVDQRKLPARVEWYICRGYRDVIAAIEKMVIRGAPAIGVAAAMGLALGARSIRASSYPAFIEKFREMSRRMSLARPTAVNLGWSVERMGRLVEGLEGRPVSEIKSALVEESKRILTEDVEINRRLGQYGQSLIPSGATVLTHCNAGALATGGYGTALGVVRAAHENAKHIKVIADETRPWLQGLRLTAFELISEGIPVSVIVDSAAGYLMQQGRIQVVVTGADRIAANGDVANKIGTYQVAVLAKTHKIPFYVAAPLSTVDATTRTGAQIPVEERTGDEIFRIARSRLGPPGVHAVNPAFDITPARYLTAIITEGGIVTPPFRKNLRNLLKNY